MGRTRWQTLVVVAVVVGALAVVLTVQASRRGSGMPQVPWLVVAVELLLAALVFMMGWAVRQFLRGKRPDLSPIRAARTAVLAKACCYTGAPLAGWYGGQALGHLIDSLPGSGMRAAAAAASAWWSRRSARCRRRRTTRPCPVRWPRTPQPADHARRSGGVPGDVRMKP